MYMMELQWQMQSLNVIELRLNTVDDLSDSIL